MPLDNYGRPMEGSSAEEAMETPQQEAVESNPDPIQAVHHHAKAALHHQQAAMHESLANIHKEHAKHHEVMAVYHSKK